MKGLYRYKSTSSHSVRWGGVFFTYGALLLVCGEQPCSLGNSLGCVWNSCETTLANNSIKCNQILVLEASFDEKRWPVWALSPLFGNFRYISFIYLHLRKLVSF